MEQKYFEIQVKTTNHDFWMFISSSETGQMSG